MREGSRFAGMRPGVLCVMTSGTQLMHKLHADNWDLTFHSVLVIRCIEKGNMSDRHLIVSTSQPYHCIEATTVLTVLTYLQGRHQVGVAYSPLGHFGLTETVQQSTITPLTKTFRNTMLCSDHQPYHSLGERHGTWSIRCVRALSPTSSSSSSQLVTSSDCNMTNDVAHEGYMDLL